MPDYVYRNATYSRDKRYRYWLTRQWDPSKIYTIFILCNPGTATEEKDSPTLTQCVSFAQRFGAGGLFLTNLYSRVSPRPHDLLTLPEAKALGFSTNFYIEKAFRTANATRTPIICGWGKIATQLPGYRNRLQYLYHLSDQYRVPLKALRLNAGGTPTHPRYLPLSSTLQKYYEPYTAS